MISDLLKPESIIFGVQTAKNTKEDAIKKTSDLCALHSGQKSRALYKAFLKREKIETTGFGSGVAIPHAKIDKLQTPFILIARFAEPVEWGSIDGKPVEVAIALVMPTTDKNNTHIKVLSSFSRKLADDSFIDRLKNEEDPNVLYNYIIKKMEEN